MKIKIWIMLLALGSTLLPAAAITPANVFELNGVRIGEDLEGVKKRLPELVCTYSCFAKGQRLLGYPGDFWAGLQDGKIAQMAFRFRPGIIGKDRAKVRAFYLKRYGPPTDNLEFEGCDEWKAHGGYLVVCLMDEVSHIWWSRQSRVDLNKRR